MTPTEILGKVSEYSTHFIVGCFVVHLLIFLFLRAWYTRDLRALAATMDDFTRHLRHRSILEGTAHLSDQIEAFIADVNDVLNQPPGSQDRISLLQRMHILDEKRRFAHSLRFETWYNLCRTMIEAYTLMGVLGTIMAIGAALQTDTAGMDANAKLELIVGRFGQGIWSTFAGLIGGISLMFINGMFEPMFSRLAENRLHVREMVAKAKRELSMSGDLTIANGDER